MNLVYDDLVKTKQGNKGFDESWYGSPVMLQDLNGIILFRLHKNALVAYRDKSNFKVGLTNDVKIK